MTASWSLKEPPPSPHLLCSWRKLLFYNEYCFRKGERVVLNPREQSERSLNEQRWEQKLLLKCRCINDFFPALVEEIWPFPTSKNLHATLLGDNGHVKARREIYVQM